VGLLIEPSRNYERGLLRGIARYSQLHGPWQFFSRLPAVSGGSRGTLPELRRWRAQGFIARGEIEVRHIRSLQVPTVFAPTRKPVPRRPNIVVDDRAVGHMAAQHLLERDLSHFAYYGMDARYFWSRRRRDGFREALGLRGHRVHAYCREDVNDPVRWEDEFPLLTQWIETLPTPVGLMVCTDDFGPLATEACREAGRRIPEDVALVGVGDDVAICDLTTVPMSSVRLDTEQAGYEAARLLAHLMRDGRLKASDVTVHPAGVTERESTNALVLHDDMVAITVRFIREHAGQPLHVDDVVRVVPLSRRALYDRFRRATGSSIYRYVQRTRLDMFTRLLRDTNLTVGEIAASMGFPDEKNVARYFRRVNGITPLAYRRRHASLATVPSGADT
jgi:LacI family transcriptional regulator